MATTIGSLDLNAFSDLYSDSTQYFWFESNASATYGAGAHVTLVPDTSFISNPTGQNILMNTDGFSIRNGLLPMMTLDNDSLDFNVVDTTAGTYVPTATFTSTGAQIGQDDKTHVNVYSNSLELTDSARNTFFKVRDAVNESGQVTDTFVGDGETTQFSLSYAASNTNYTVTQNGTTVSPTKTTTTITFSTAPAVGDIIVVVYNVVGNSAKAYDLGIRGTNTISGLYSVIEGLDTIASGDYSHAEGYITVASGSHSHAEGNNTKASGNCSHAEGSDTMARGDYSHTEGYYTNASGIYSHAEGLGTNAIGKYSHAEGSNCNARDNCAHAEGSSTTASGKLSHAEGGRTTASGDYSHAKGHGSTASGDVSHAEGYYSTTNGYGAHVEGYATRASGNVSHVMGMFNKEDPSYYALTTDSYVHSNKTYYTYNYDAYTPVSNPTDDQISTYYEHLDYEAGEMINGGYAFIIGNGTSTRTRSNALTVDWNGGIQMFLDSDGTSSSAATTGDDMDLFNAIYDLGWYSDVIV